MVSTLNTQQAVAAARCRIYLLLANLLRFPDEYSGVLLESRTWDVLLAAADYLNEDAGANVAVLANSLRESLRDSSIKDLETVHMTVFGASVRGKVTPYECEYGNKEIFQLAGDMSDIAAFYSAFGLRANEMTHERLDHVAAECEFMAQLCAQEAESHDDSERLEIVVEAQKKFLREHLGRWGVAFAHQLEVVSAGTLYQTTAGLLEAMLLADCERLGVPRGANYLSLRTAPPADDPSHCMNCGKPPNLPGDVPLNEEE